MTGSASPEALRENYGINPAEIEQQTAPAGTFLLRRAHYLNEIEQGMLLSAEQQQALINLVKGEDFEAKQKVIAHNLRLVAGIAMRYADRGVEFVDLVRAGAMGLIHALENFELEGGFRFAAYAARNVRENIERTFTNMNRNNCLSAGACRISSSPASVV